MKRSLLMAGVLVMAALAAILMWPSSDQEHAFDSATGVAVSFAGSPVAPPVRLSPSTLPTLSTDSLERELLLVEAQREGEEEFVFKARSSFMDRLDWFFAKAGLEPAQKRALLVVFLDVQHNYDLLHEELRGNRVDFSTGRDDPYSFDGVDNALAALGADAESQLQSILTPEQLKLLKKTYGLPDALARSIGFTKPIEVASR